MGSCSARLHIGKDGKYLGRMCRSVPSQPEYEGACIEACFMMQTQARTWRFAQGMRGPRAHAGLWCEAWVGLPRTLQARHSV